MEHYGDVIYIIGNSKSQQNNPITHLYGAFVIGFVVDRKSEKIIDVECNAVMPLTSKFIQSIFIGKSITCDFDKLKAEVELRYLGSSQKAIIVAFKDVQKKYTEYLEGKEISY